MRIITSLRGLALGLALAAPLAASANASIEDTIWRDQANAVYQTTQVAPSRIAKGPSVTASDASPALAIPVQYGAQTNGSGLPVSGTTGEELPGYTLGGF
jgi:hypothetical protein